MLDSRLDCFHSRSMAESESVYALTKEIDQFLSDNSATPEQVKDVANECLGAS